MPLVNRKKGLSEPRAQRENSRGFQGYGKGKDLNCHGWLGSSRAFNYRIVLQRNRELPPRSATRTRAM